MSDIWWVNQYAITPDLPGGTRHYDLAVELARRGYRMKIFASDVNLSLRRRTKLQPRQLYAVEPRDGIEFVWIQSAEYEINNWRRTWNMLSFSRNFMQVAKRMELGFPPEVVIGSSPHPFAALAAERVAARTGARFMLELRDLWPQALIDMGGLSEKQPAVWAMRALERYLYRRADRLIVLAKGSLEYLVQRGVGPEKTLFLPNGVHLGHFRPSMSRSEARAAYGFQRFTVLYAGAHGPANSLETLVEAARLLTDLPVEFVLVGDGPAKASLVQLAQREHVTNVRFLEPVSKASVINLLHAADAGLITLRNVKVFEYGISPNKLFDYMAAERPILCSVPGEMSSMVREAEAGLISTPEDPDALAESVRKMFSMSEAERFRLGRNGREYLTQHFRREVLADALADLLSDSRARQFREA